MSYTVDDIKELYGDVVAANDVVFYRLLNEAEARLLESAKWNWCKARADLAVVDSHIYVDTSEYAALLGVLVDGGARVIRVQDVEFTPGFGTSAVAGDPGYGDLIDCGRVTVDLGEGAVIRKKYKIAGVTTDTTAECLLHRAHVRLIDGADVPLCESVRALKLGMQAIVYEEADDTDRADAFWAKAYRALNEQESTQRGGARGTLLVQPSGEGLDPVGNII